MVLQILNDISPNFVKDHSLVCGVIRIYIQMKANTVLEVLAENSVIF
jgi:hypothetical protein